MKKIMFNDKYGLTQAVLEGRKTMTRRIEKGLENLENGVFCFHGKNEIHLYGEGGTIVEKIKTHYQSGEVVAVAQAYKELYPNADFRMVGDEFMTESAGWKNKMFVRADVMPHHIKITEVKVERLQDISAEDCLREGILKKSDFPYKKTCPFYFAGGKHEWDNSFRTPRQAYAALIDKISGKGTWERNPWVYVYDFKLIK
ncbi:MAG: hypothetical protein J6U04_09555 [Salinivirgaceae bacterium]|nr:hypothetical protein [Salinivirgaceae bacterium]